jgi:hypothetical protein
MMIQCHKIPFAAALILALTLAHLCAADVSIKVTTERPGALYQVGETATFIIEANQD